ncbi:unnamed protein product (macronuclear) [Paramecium tetraurelia]|uniref:Uncharacterized protein n=1 Tax=Paramecium tetraurelia TaxID=5888 RepID=A0EB37_PARTE|nr:uncharacterized protein GSPATT00025238001 [Paramecium tetraurelia]CAK92504.1 unnamed protein product [Paramecium tetraurelia]|eukprot:XP_001459901.1 hypothetical protein (macronuclear) [Paramecium tetraurelia strain d4-2]
MNQIHKILFQVLSQIALTAVVKKRRVFQKKQRVRVILIYQIQNRIDNKANTPEMIRTLNTNFSPPIKYTDILKTIKQSSHNQPSKIQIIYDVDFDQAKNRVSSQFKSPKEVTPTKKHTQTIFGNHRD